MKKQNNKNNKSKKTNTNIIYDTDLCYYGGTIYPVDIALKIMFGLDPYKTYCGSGQSIPNNQKEV